MVSRKFWPVLALAVPALLTAANSGNAGPLKPENLEGNASWYGEEHRGKLMANGQPFDPDKLTAACWFYPLGTKVLVSLHSASGRRRALVVTITDRGPARELVARGRVIDLSRAAFETLGDPDTGLLPVKLRPLDCLPETKMKMGLISRPIKGGARSRRG